MTWAKKILQIVLILLLSISAVAAFVSSEIPSKVTLTIVTVNNPDMIVMQRLSAYFEKENPNIHLQWVTLPENDLRQKLTLDISTNTGSFDIATVGLYEVPIWAKNQWLISIDKLFEKYPEYKVDYDLNDVLLPIRSGLTYNKQLYALPFYGESSMTYYRKDLFDKAGITMPNHPTWAQISEFAQRIHDPNHGVYGIGLRGLPGWGENVALFSTMVNTWGGCWFDLNWNPQILSEPWNQALTFYVDLLQKAGPPGVTGNGFTENLTLFSQGKTAIWVDTTVAAGFVSDKTTSKVFDKVGYAHAPVGPGTSRGSNWLWSWALSIPKTVSHPKEAFQFVTWATSKKYIELVAKEQNSWASVPPGTRQSTYDRPEYQKAAGQFAPLVLASIKRADPLRPTKNPVPYTGIQFVEIPEFQALGMQVGQHLAAAIASKETVKDALKQSQIVAERVVKDDGYKP